MSGKNYNSIVFFTTLCLGLILVGTTPYLSSQFASNRIDEIEVVEEYGFIPEDDTDFQILLITLLKEIDDEVRNQGVFDSIQVNYHSSYDLKYRDSETISSGEASFKNQRLNYIVPRFLLSKILPQALALSDVDKKYKESKVEIKSNDSEVILQISFSANDAKTISDFLKRKYTVKKENTTNVLLKSLYQNTDVSISNNQVFIITRLPRAGIDSLGN